ncbi:TPA: hypothetical protein ACPWS4_003396 [Pseudomonas aeruginosa]|nr:hypothetical protein [Pseudomonas aeruginosa]HBO1888567.1 hypothetical protein [Pseudomonas aeruginosa]
MFDQLEYEGFFEDYSHCDKESFGHEIDHIDFENVSQVCAAIALILHILSDCKSNIAVEENEEGNLCFHIENVEIPYDIAKKNLEERRGVGYLIDCYVNERSLNTALNW